MITTQKFAVGDRVSWPGAGGDGTVIGMDVKNPWTPPQALVRWDAGGDSFFPVDALHPADRQAVIEADTFTRLAEIDAYADRAGCDRAEAVRRLVNTALSHLCNVCGQDIGEPERVSGSHYAGMCPRCRKSVMGRVSCV